jgi:hypothetical protein
VNAILPSGLVKADQLEVGLVDEVRSLQGMASALTRHVAFCEPTQFFVNRGNELIDRRFVTGSDRGEQVGYF